MFQKVLMMGLINMAPSKNKPRKKEVVKIPMNSLICITLVICTSLKVK
jgi:hypothetical protein